MDAIQLSWVISAFTLASVIFILPFGRLADIHGRKRLYTWGVIGFTLISLALYFVDSSFFLIALRAVQGVTGALIFSTGAAILSSVFQPGERGRALGIYSATVYLGLSLGPFVGGILTHQLGWRSIFGVVVFLSVIAIVIIYTRMKGDWADARGEKFDIVGSLIFSISLFAVVYGFSTLPDVSGAWIILVGVLGMAAFVRYEMKSKSPFLNMNLFRDNRAFTFSSLAALINYSAIFAISFQMSLFLQYIKGFSPQNAGFILLAQPVVQTIVSPVSGRISDRVQPRIIASIGLALNTIALTAFAFINENTSPVYLIGGLIVAGLGAGLFTSPNTNAIMSSVDKKYYGIAAAITSTMRNMGVVFSMGIVMIIFTVFMGRVQITPEYYGLFQQSVRTIFTASSAICFCGIFVSLFRGNVDIAAADNDNGS